LTRDSGARLTILHVASLPDFATYGEFEKLLHHSSDYRKALESKIRECRKPDCNAEFRLEEGNAADEILHVAQEIGCDLIIAGAHGRTGLGRLLMGSVAEKVLRHATCPVLTVNFPRPPERANLTSGECSTVSTVN